MNAYTVSRLATDAGVSTSVVRDYETRGLLCPCRCTPAGYRIYDRRALERLRLILDAKAAGISLAMMTDLCRALEDGDRAAVKTVLKEIRATLDRHESAIERFRDCLAGIGLAKPVATIAAAESSR
ncbi:MAG TPA: MerR family transcriptional regulator [Thioalkalivibrio sp.]|nr:MerR family transcriptional regulator [Thioalkalivibrio sp.]